MMDLDALEGDHELYGVTWLYNWLKDKVSA